MDIVGQQHIAADRQRVWAALHDPEMLKRCLPGCESVERATSDEFRVVLKLVIGPLRARFQGRLTMVETRAPGFCVMSFEGQGGTVGFGRGSANVTLSEVDGGTDLAYVAKVQVGGNLAQIGSRLIDSFAKKMTDDFFRAFRAQLQPGTTEPAATGATPIVPDHDAKAPAHLPALALATAAHGTDQPRVPAWWLAPAALMGAFMGAFLTILGARLMSA